MERLVRAYYVPELDTSDVWFGEREEAAESAEVGEGVVVKLDKDGGIIGVEIISLSKTGREELANLPVDIRQALVESIRKLAAAASRVVQS